MEHKLELIKRFCGEQIYHNLRMELLFDKELAEDFDNIGEEEFEEMLSYKDYDKLKAWIRTGLVRRVMGSKIKEHEEHFRKELLKALYGGK